jgi:hypothetical protein
MRKSFIPLIEIRMELFRKLPEGGIQITGC